MGGEEEVRLHADDQRLLQLDLAESPLQGAAVVGGVEQVHGPG